MKNLANISALWAEHEKASFPQGHRNIQCGGQSLTLVQADAASNVIAYLSSQKRIMDRRIEQLKGISAKLAESIPTLQTEARPYFQRLKKIIDLVIEDHANV